MAAMDALAAADPHIAARLAEVGHPEPRIRPPGYETLLRTIVGQQVSVAAASAIWRKLEAAIVDVDGYDGIAACDLGGHQAREANGADTEDGN